jgi:hypothetical protein
MGVPNYRQITRHPHGVSTYELAGDDRGRWLVSRNEQWLPGVYDSETTALRAIRIDTLLGPIYRTDGENRPVTMADLDAILHGCGYLEDTFACRIRHQSLQTGWAKGDH